MKSHAEDRGMGRISKIDPLDKHYPMRAAIRRITPTKSRIWNTGPILDQGPDPFCVGFAWRQWLCSAPLMTSDGPSARDIYIRAQELDEIFGENYDGTTVRGGAKALEESGRIKQYLWAESVLDIRDFLLTQGTVVVGTDWFEGMENTSFLNYAKPTGANMGGHAYLLAGYSHRRDAFRIVNSWGRDWGYNGRAWIKLEDFALLLAANGEACTALEQPVIKPSTT